MADYVLESRLTLRRPRDQVFRFFADPASLPLLTPPTWRLGVVGVPPALGAGAVIDIRLCWLGLPLRWRAYVREWDPPYRFVDVQVRGPWARWEHRHRFLEAGAGTLVEDRVTYRPPLGVAGRLVHAAVLDRQLRRLWAYRRRRLGELMGPLAESDG
jgi:hypothetical protein